MKYFVVFDASSNMTEEQQRDRVRLALTAGLPAKEPGLRLLEDQDHSPANNDDEISFARRIHRNTAQGKKKTADGEPEQETECTLTAIGDGARFALDSLAELAKLNSSTLSERNYSSSVQLVLIAPRIHTSEFLETADALARGALASRVCRRIVVLYSDAGSPNPTNLALNGRLGLWGPSGKCFANVLALDVSSLVLSHLPGISAFLGSLEVLGLIGRAVNGASDGTLRRMALRGVVPDSKSA